MQRIADQPRDRRCANRHDLGRRRWGLVWRHRWRSTDGGESWGLCKLTKGTTDEWAANDPDTATFLN